MKGNFMESIRKFYSGLNRSTKITLVSCGSFLLLTILILLIFVLFPITPSERLISGLGRGGAISDSNNDNNNNDNNEGAVPLITTAENNNDSEIKGTTAVQLDDYVFSENMATYTNSGTFYSYIYSGEGIRTGTPGQNDFTTVTTINPEPTTEPTTDNPDEPQETTGVTTDEPAQTTDVNGTTQSVVGTTTAKSETKPVTQAPTEAPTAAPPKQTEAPAVSPEEETE